METKEEESPEVEEVTSEDPPEPADPVPESEEVLLNGGIATPDIPPPIETSDESLVNFMHDSQLDRSESQLSPHAPEFQPGTSPSGSASPEPLGNSDRATFGEFSQEDAVENIVSEEVKCEAPVAWSSGEPDTPTTTLEEPVNPWSKKSTLDWGNSSLPLEDKSCPVWSGDAPAETTNWSAETEQPAENWSQAPQMRDQTTQKVDDDGFTEVDRRRGGNRRGADSPGGSYRNNNPRGNGRFNSRGGSYGRGGNRGGERGGRGGRPEGRGGRGGPRGRGGPSNDRGGRGRAAPRAGTRPQSAQRGGPVMS